MLAKSLVLTTRNDEEFCRNMKHIVKLDYELREMGQPFYRDLTDSLCHTELCNRHGIICVFYWSAESFSSRGVHSRFWRGAAERS